LRDQRPNKKGKIDSGIRHDFAHERKPEDAVEIPKKGNRRKGIENGRMKNLPTTWVNCRGEKGKIVQQKDARKVGSPTRRKMWQV